MKVSVNNAREISEGLTKIKSYDDQIRVLNEIAVKLSNGIIRAEVEIKIEHEPEEKKEVIDRDGDLMSHCNDATRYGTGQMMGFLMTPEDFKRAVSSHPFSQRQPINMVAIKDVLTEIGGLRLLQILLDEKKAARNKIVVELQKYGIEL